MAWNTCITVGMPSISAISTVSIIGQNGNERSAITSMLVCRTRLRSELICGLSIPVFSIVVCSKRLGIGDWGLAIGNWGSPNPQSLIPNLQSLDFRHDQHGLDYAGL